MTSMRQVCAFFCSHSFVYLELWQRISSYTKKSNYLYPFFPGRAQLQGNNVKLMTFDNRMPWDHGERIHGLIDWNTGHYHSKVRHSITSSPQGLITRPTETLFTRTRHPPLWLQNLIYIQWNGNYEEKKKTSFLHPTCLTFICISSNRLRLQIEPYTYVTHKLEPLQWRTLKTTLDNKYDVRHKP